MKPVHFICIFNCLISLNSVIASSIFVYWWLMKAGCGPIGKDGHDVCASGLVLINAGRFKPVWGFRLSGKISQIGLFWEAFYTVFFLQWICVHYVTFYILVNHSLQFCLYLIKGPSYSIPNGVWCHHWCHTIWMWHCNCHSKKKSL